jgi:hypothetical protein
MPVVELTDSKALTTSLPSPLAELLDSVPGRS